MLPDTQRSFTTRVLSMITTEMRLGIKRLKGKGPQLQLQPMLSRASNLRFSMSLPVRGQ